MGLETPAFQRRLIKKLQKGRPTLQELLERICPKDGVPVTSAGACPVCRAQIQEPPEPDPIPDGVMRPVDPAKAELQRQFYARLARQRAEREGRSRSRACPDQAEDHEPG
jgi:hypothetical protein